MKCESFRYFWLRGNLTFVCPSILKGGTVDLQSPERGPVDVQSSEPQVARIGHRLRRKDV